MRLIFTQKLEKSKVNPHLMIIFFNMLNERIAAHETISIIDVEEKQDISNKLMAYTVIIFSTLEGQEKFYFNCHHAIDMSCSNTTISREPEPACLCGVKYKDKKTCPRHKYSGTYPQLTV